MSITDKSAEADFFVAFSRQYKLSTPKTCISQKILVPLHAKLRADNKRDKKKPQRVLIHKRPGTSSRQTGGVASAEKGKNMTYNRNKHIGNKYYAAIYNII